MNSDVIMFSCISADGRSVCLSYKVPEDYTIFTFHRLCKRFAAAMGYGENSIEDAFGETVYDEV